MMKGTSGYPLSAIRYPLLAAATLFIVACSPKGEALYARAEKSLASGEVRAAVIDLKNLVKDEPGNAKARALLADALVQGGDISAGAVEIQKARELGADEASLHVPDCRVMTARGEFDDVLAKCRPEGVVAAILPDMHIATGRALLGLERAAEAKAHFEVALQARPDSLDALLGLASAVYATEGLAAATATVAGAPEAIRKQPAYWLTIGSLNMQGGDFAAAEQAFQSAVTSITSDGDADQRLTALGALAEAQMRQGKVKEARATTDQLIKAAPSNPLVQQLRAQVEAAAGNLDEARTLLEKAVAAMPDNYSARTLLGIVNLQQGNLGQAEMHFQNVLANRPKDVQAQKLLAETRARLKSPEESLEALRPALAQADADPALLAMAGRMSMATGEREQALAYLAQASAGSSQPQTPEVQLEIAGGFLMAGDLDRDIELLGKVPDGGEAGHRRDYLLMLALLRKGENEQAVAQAKALVERAPADFQARNLAGSVLAAAGQKIDARAQFEAAAKLEPGGQQSYLNLARLDLVEGKVADAERNFRKVLDIDPKNALAVVGLAMAANARDDKVAAEKWLQQASREHPDAVDVQLLLIQFYIGQRNFGEARKVLDAAAKKSPGNAALSNARGFVLLGGNDVAGAIGSFMEATKLAPKAYGYALNLARAHLANRDLDAALAVLDAVIRAEPRFLSALVLAGSAAIQGGKIERAAGYVERLSKAAPDAQSALSLEGDLAMAQKRYKDALQDYRKAATKGRTRELALAEYRAGALARIDRPEAVLEAWNADHPGDPPVLAVLADIRQSQGNVGEAIKMYEQALVKAPNDALLLNNLAVLYQGQKDPRALDLASRAYKSSPKAASIQDTYGWLLVEAGRVDEAIPLLRDALKSMPANAEVQYHLAAALASKGASDEAVALLKKAVNGDLPPTAKADAKALLDRLGK